MDQQDYRKEFLLKMYDQLSNENSRHITGAWQAVSVLIGAFAIFALTEKQIITMDMATTLIIGLSAWFIANIIDSNYWYNRNLAIIANIERQFLENQDKHHIHFYFTEHRSTNSILTNYKIQGSLGMIIAVAVILYHFSTRVFPGFWAPLSTFELARCLPYATGFASAYILWSLQKKRVKDYQVFLQNSPGVTVDKNGVTFGNGHPI